MNVMLWISTDTGKTCLVSFLELKHYYHIQRVGGDALACVTILQKNIYIYRYVHIYADVHISSSIRIQRISLPSQQLRVQTNQIW